MIMMRLVVPEGQQDAQLKDCVLDMLPKLRPSMVDRLFKKGDIKQNGQRVRRDGPVQAGDVLEVYLDEDAAAYLPEPEVVYEDENIIVFNKQPGLSCVSDKVDGKPTLYTLAREYMKSTGEYNEDTLSVPYICHRLDHNTGGLVLVAKSQQMFEFLFETFKQRRVRKFYQAIVCGHPAQNEAELHDYLIKDAGRAKVKIISNPGRNALPVVTRFTLDAQNDELSLLDVELVTGRTHQARAHLAYHGLPILGDDKYGNRRMNKKYGARYQALWAYKLRFETGVNNPLEYLNGREIQTDNIRFPYVAFDEDASPGK